MENSTVEPGSVKPPRFKWPSATWATVSTGKFSRPLPPVSTSPGALGADAIAADRVVLVQVAPRTGGRVDPAPHVGHEQVADHLGLAAAAGDVHAVDDRAAERVLADLVALDRPAVRVQVQKDPLV